MADGIKIKCPNCGRDYFITGGHIQFKCVGCQCEISANGNEVTTNQKSDHSIALAVWGIVLFWLVPLSLFFVIKALVLGIKRKRIATIVLASIPIVLWTAAIIYYIVYTVTNPVSNITFE